MNDRKIIKILHKYIIERNCDKYLLRRQSLLDKEILDLRLKNADLEFLLYKQIGVSRDRIFRWLSSNAREFVGLNARYRVIDIDHLISQLNNGFKDYE